MDGLLRYIRYTKVVPMVMESIGTKDNYTLENGDVYEHTFELPDNITVEEFQAMLDNAKETLKNTLNIDE